MLYSTIYDIIEWIKQYFKDLHMNDQFQRNNSENDEKYHFNENIHYVSMDCILMCIINVIWIEFYIYQSINYLLFQEIISLCHCNKL